jgi:hypothetical protein
MIPDSLSSGKSGTAASQKGIMKRIVLLTEKGGFCEGP